METQPIPPVRKPPLGSGFYVLLLLPIVLMALTFTLQSTDLSTVLFIATVGSTFICSLMVSAKLGRRFTKQESSSIGLAFLFFFALQTFYVVCFFIGCTAMITTA